MHLSTKVLYDDILELSTNWFTIYYLHYKNISKIIKCIYNSLFLRPLPQLLSLFGDQSNCIVKLDTHYSNYKEKLEMTELLYNLPLFQPLLKLLLLFSALFDYILKILILSYYVLKVGKYLFTTYHPHYKDKLIGN